MYLLRKRWDAGLVALTLLTLLESGARCWVLEKDRAGAVVKGTAVQDESSGLLMDMCSPCNLIDARCISQDMPFCITLSSRVVVSTWS